ncbi:YdeI family protein [Phenylobacterium aquaticum]|uniref:YdeI/OmpD-associated family protein n=1 Tax=Phenylobacterium aquaticum TaxID=1763816 RepID=UPI0026EC61A2|nr:YdeI/OmpD-associated family protein [Phenylobacterium aquaticum]
MSETPTFFETQAAWRDWLARHHGGRTELAVGFWKVGSGRPSMTWPQSVDEALCFGWIDGVRHRIDEVAYRIRFTPRKPGGVWSQVNLARFAELEALGLIAPAGHAAHAVGKDRTFQYSYEKPEAFFSPEETALLQANALAWAGFQAFPAWYRKVAIHRVVSAKTAPTRAKRMAILIDACAQGRRLGSPTKLEPLK